MGTYKTAENPSWWTEKHSSAWDRVKDAFARDWEQTKADFSKTKGRELNQNVADTVKQAAGTEPIPPGQIPNDKPDDEYGRVEPAFRYGYAASSHYADHKDWDISLEGKLRNDWERLHADSKFDNVKDHVKSAWQRARNP